MVHMFNSTWIRGTRNTNSWLHSRFPHGSHSAQGSYFFSNHLVNHPTDIHDTAKTMYPFRLTFLVEAANEITSSHRFNLLINRAWECNMCELIHYILVPFQHLSFVVKKIIISVLLKEIGGIIFKKFLNFFMGILYKKRT